MHGSGSKIPSKKSRQERRAERFNSGVKGLKHDPNCAYYVITQRSGTLEFIQA
jgi:hypothetical protein